MIRALLILCLGLVFFRGMRTKPDEHASGYANDDDNDDRECPDAARADKNGRREVWDDMKAVLRLLGRAVPKRQGCTWGARLSEHPGRRRVEPGG